MSDSGRKDISDKIESSLKPDSLKSTAENLKDKFTNSVDNAVGDSTSNKDKSWPQKASDTVYNK